MLIITTAEVFGREARAGEITLCDERGKLRNTAHAGLARVFSGE